MKKSKNNNIILGFSFWVLVFGFSWCKGKIIHFEKVFKVRNSGDKFRQFGANKHGVKYIQDVLEPMAIVDKATFF